MPTEQIVTRYIVDELLPGGGTASVAPDTSLISTGILDSIALLKLILFLEERFHVKVGDREVIPGNFETVERIVSFVDAKERVSG